MVGMSHTSRFLETHSRGSFGFRTQMGATRSDSSPVRAFSQSLFHPTALIFCLQRGRAARSRCTASEPMLAVFAKYHGRELLLVSAPRVSIRKSSTWLAVRLTLRSS